MTGFRPLLAALEFRQMITTWGGIKPAIAAGPKGPVFRPFRWVVVPLAILILFTVISRLGNFDFEIEKAIYVAGGDSWDFGTRSLWWFLYEFGTIPAAVLCGLAVAGFCLGLFREKWRRWRQTYLFIILLGVIGPGVISNLVLKEYWGRPRPRSVLGLGGQSAYEPVLTYDRTSGGKSFPCGHATMGYFFVGGFFLLRRYRRDWAWFFLIFGLCLGFFMGVARMCQGGHFFSDVMWAGAIMYFTSMGLYYALKLHRGLDRGEAARKPTPLWLKVAAPAAGVALLGGILLGSPYREIRNYRLITEHGKRNPLQAILTLKTGSVEILPGKKFKVTGEAWGHGVPTSKVGVHFVEYEQGKSTTVHYKERISGRFTEVDQDLKVTLPWDRVRVLTIDASDCEVKVTLPPEFDGSKRIVISGGNGAVTLTSAPNGFSWNDESDKSKFGAPADSVNQGSPVIDVLDAFSGKLILNR